VLFLLYLLIFISFNDLFAQLPIVSIYAENLGADPNTGIIGFIVGIYSFSNLLSNFFSGLLVDKNGPKKILIAGFLINGIILFLYTIIQTPEQLLWVRFLNGLSAGIITPAAFTYITLYNKSTHQHHGRTMAYAGAAVGLAAIGGPTYSGIVSARLGQPEVYMIISIFMLIGLVISLFIKPLQKEKADYGDSTASDARNVFALLKNKGLLIAFFGSVAFAASQGILAYMLPLKASALHIENHLTGILISTFGIVAILFFLLPTNRVYDRFHNEYVLPIGLIVVAASDLLLYTAQSLKMLFIGMVCYGIGFALIFPSMANLVSKHSARNIRGTAFGIFYGCISVGSFLGSSITGAFTLTPDEAFASVAAVLFIIATSIILLARKVTVRSHLK
jgi:MFS family permease